MEYTEREVTKREYERTVSVCDSCGRELDDDAKTFREEPHVEFRSIPGGQADDRTLLQPDEEAEVSFSELSRAGVMSPGSAEEMTLCKVCSEHVEEQNKFAAEIDRELGFSHDESGEQ